MFNRYFIFKNFGSSTPMFSELRHELMLSELGLSSGELGLININ